MVETIAEKLISLYGLAGIVILAQWFMIISLWKHINQETKGARVREKGYTDKIVELSNKGLVAMEKLKEGFDDMQKLNSRLFDLLEKNIAVQTEIKSLMEQVRSSLR